MLWLSAKEIADAAAAGLMPGMPTTKRNVNAYADRHRWADTAQARLRGGREGGGGLEYHVDLLPPAAQLAWLGHHLKVTDEDLRIELSDGPVDDAFEARVVIVRLVDKFRHQTLMSQTATDTVFCALFNSGQVSVPAWIADQAKTMSPRTLARWRQALTGGPKHLRRGRPKGSGVLDRAEGGEVRSFVMAVHARSPLLSVKQIRNRVLHQFGETLEVADRATGELMRVPLPSLRMFQVAFREWKQAHRNELVRLTDPDGYRSRIEFSATGTQRSDRLNQMWMVDASPADVMLKGGRHSVYVAIDLYSRRAMVLATKTPRSSAVGLLVRNACRNWGVPEEIYTDNGSDFVARDTQRLFAQLDIATRRSPRYEPKTKGVVERVIGTFQRGLAGLPGFVGHSVADRKKIENRKSFAQRTNITEEKLFEVQMDVEEFQRWCDDWASTIYAHSPHSALRGRTPFEVAAEWGGSVRWIEHEAALDVLLAPVATGDGLRRVTKQGVRVDHYHYLPMGNARPGQTVLVRMDPADLGRVKLFEPDGGEWLGEAICAELLGLDPAEVLARAKAIENAAQRGIIDDIRRHQRRMKPMDQAVADLSAAQGRAGQLVAFPHRKETHSSPALTAAAEAVAASAPTPDTSRRSPEAAMRNAAFIATFKRPETPVETRRDRFLRAVTLEARIERGDEVNDADHAWLAVYREQPEYQTQALMCADFGFEKIMGQPRPA